MKRLFCVLVFLALPAVTQAQTNPCDTPGTTPPSGTAVVNSTISLSACLAPTATDGTPLVVITGWTIYDNGVSTALAMTKGATSTVTNLSQFTGNWIVPATTGTHTLQVTATGANCVIGPTCNAKESAKSNPFALTVNPVPAGPVAPVGFFGR
jgi:hypothetical protein